VKHHCNFWRLKQEDLEFEASLSEGRREGRKFTRLTMCWSLVGNRKEKSLLKVIRGLKCQYTSKKTGSTRY
jgi:hypothetical protein